MNKNRQEPNLHTNARRRLVRGVFAAPAALSLYSGSAFAVQSLSCVARDVAVGHEPEISDGTDTFVRVRLYNLTDTATTDNVIWWISGKDLTAWKAPSTHMNESQWQCFSIFMEGTPAESITVGAVKLDVGQLIDTQPSLEGWTFNSSSTFVAVRVDDVGNIKSVVGLGSGKEDGFFAVHQSCWASFRPIN